MGRVNASSPLALGVPFKLDIAVDEREEGVVSAHAHIATGHDLGAALPHDDVTGDDAFSAEFLDAQALARAVCARCESCLPPSYEPSVSSSWTISAICSLV